MLRQSSDGQAAGAAPPLLTAAAVPPCPCRRMKAAAAILLALVCCAQCASASRLFMAREEFQAEQTGRRALMAAGGESVARGLPCSSLGPRLAAATPWEAYTARSGPALAGRPAPR